MATKFSQNLDITGVVTATSFSGDGSALTGVSGGGGLSNVIEDTTPQLGGDLDGLGNKVLFANVYDNLVDLPSASTYHGMFAHVHATGKAYFAHAGAWVRLADYSEVGGGGGGGSPAWSSITDINNASGPTKIAIGTNAGSTSQGNTTVAVGFEAGKENQGTAAVAIGDSAGESGQGTSSVAVGLASGKTNQGIYSTAIGYQAGKTTQGQYSVAIGNEAGKTNQAVNSIVINATSGILENIQASSLVIKPIRNASGTHGMEYNPTTGEVTYDTLGGGGGGSTGDISFTGSTLSSSGATITLDDNVTITGTLTSSQAGAPILTSASTLTLQATTRTTIANTPLKLASFTTTARNALSAADGDMIYNSTTNKFQGFANGSWVDLH